MVDLVTGGAGFIGSHVVRSLLRRGRHVRVMHLPHEDLRNLHTLDYEPFAGDITDPTAVSRAVQGCDRVFHLAAMYALWLPEPERMRRVNVQGTQNILRACGDAGVSKVVYTSSVGVFGGQGLDRDATEASHCALHSTGDVYLQSKWESHFVAERFAASGLNISIVAPCGPLGPGDVGPTPTGRLLISAVDYPVIPVIDTVVNVADVRDMGEGHVLAAERGRPGESYILGCRNLAWTELARIALSVCGLRKRIVRLPHRLATLSSKVALAWTNHVSHRAPIITPATLAVSRLGMRADCTKAVRELGLPQSPIETAVRDALTWFARNGRLKDRRAIEYLLRAGQEGNRS